MLHTHTNPIRYTHTHTKTLYATHTHTNPTCIHTHANPIRYTHANTIHYTHVKPTSNANRCKMFSPFLQYGQAVGEEAVERFLQSQRHLRVPVVLDAVYVAKLGQVAHVGNETVHRLGLETEQWKCQ